MKFNIQIQPATNFHYRYVSELNTPHGVLTGYRARQEDSDEVINYPKIHLSLSEAASTSLKRKFYVLCSLHNFANKCLSHHMLMPYDETVPDYSFIFENMNELSEAEYSWELKDYIIVRSKTKEISDFRTTLEGKARKYEQLGLPLEFETLKGDIDLANAKSRKQSAGLDVCLGFTIFEKIHNGTFKLCQETTFSNVIYHGDDLNIKRICNPKGDVHQKTDITLLIGFNSEYPIYVKMYRQGVNWTKVIPIPKHEDFQFRQAAIIFTAPPYDGPSCSDEEIEILMHVAVGNSLYRSSDVKFFYTNNREENPGRKRARRENETEVGAATNTNETNRMDQVPIYINYVIALPQNQEVQIEETNTIERQIILEEENGNQINYGEKMIFTNQILDPVENNTNYSHHPLDFEGEDIPDIQMQNSFATNSTEDQITPAEVQLPQNDVQYLTEFVANNDYCPTSPDLRDFDIQAFMERTLDIVPSNISLIETLPDDGSVSSDSHVSRDSLGSEINKLDLSEKMNNLHISNIGGQHLKLQEISLKKNVKSDSIMKYEKAIKMLDINKKDLNVAFHQALRNPNSVQRFYKAFNNTPYKPLVRQARNENSENLLHYACKHNKSFAIRPLIGLGCRIQEQDQNGRTPLHIAMEYEHEDCISKIQQLLEDHSDYPTEVKYNFIKMLQAYNHKGYTVLHVAILENRLKLMEIMLKFCCENKINIFNNEVLANGDSIGHLMVKHNLVDMAKMFKLNGGDLFKGIVGTKNYSGETALEYMEISEEMKKLLTMDNGI